MSTTPAPVPAPRARLARRVFRWMLPVLVIGAAAGVWQRERLWIWYCAERLERASGDDRTAWADRLTDAGEPALPMMLNLLRHDDPGVCAAGRGAIEKLAASWPKDDPRRAGFARQFVDAEPRFSTPGRAAALDLLPLVLACGEPDVVDRAKGMVA